MRTRHIRSTAAALAAAALLSAPAVADDPTGTYPDASVRGKLTDGGGNTVGFDLIVSKLKLARTKIKIRATDEDFEVSVKLTLNLRDRVTNSNRQTLKVTGGSVSLKDIATGTPLAWDGQFNSATYKVKQKSSGLFQLKHKKKLIIANLVGHPLYHGGQVKSVKVVAKR